MILAKKRAAWMDYALIILGSFLIGYAIKNIYDPANLVTGGVSGFAVIFNALWHVPLWITNTVLNIPLFFITYKIKGWRFMVRTVLATLTLSVALAILPEAPLIADRDPLLSALFGGIITGVGTGLIFLCRATTGGTDMMAADIQHFMRHRTIAQILMVLDALVVLLGAGVFGVKTALYAVIAIYVVTKLSDAIVDGIKYGRVLWIVSERPEEIAAAVLEKLERGVTALHATGMYTGNDKFMLYCVVTHREVPAVKDIIYEIDPQAFVTVTDAKEVMGEGFIEHADAT